MRYMSCFDLTHAPVATTARAAATGPVSMSARPDPEGSDTVEIATRRCTLSSADLGLQNTGAIASAEYGRLAVLAHLPLFSELGAASTGSWKCWCSTSTVDSFSFLILAFVFHAYPRFVLYPLFFPRK